MAVKRLDAGSRARGRGLQPEKPLAGLPGGAGPELGAVLVAARMDWITHRARPLSQLLEEGASIRPADIPV